jgi:hypothetical protein
VVGGASVAVSLAGHLGGGGRVPPAAVLVLVVAAASAVCWRLSSLRWTPMRLAGVLLLAQGLLHVVFDVSAAGATTNGGRMLASHVAASLVTTVLLERGETVLWALLDALVLRVLRILDVDVPARGLPGTVIGPGVAGGRSDWWVGSAPRRGPPVLAAA